LLPVFAGFIEMVVAAFGELVGDHNAPDDNDQYYPKNNAWLHDIALAETQRESSWLFFEKRKILIGLVSLSLQ
jgi:hypothetical protein